MISVIFHKSPAGNSPETHKGIGAYNWALSFYREQNKHEYYSFISNHATSRDFNGVLLEYRSFCGVLFSKLGKYGTFYGTVILPLFPLLTFQWITDALPLHTKCTLFIVVLIVVVHPL
ncbi:hypothetical protein ACTHS9_31065 [Bacillus mycoides]|uniref:hypothetical protein n=1 Tax=Bacillus mycoides TaxID=1405 RepID=UPI003F7C3474